MLLQRVRNPAFQGRFDLIFLWDVIEHISDEDSFLKAVLFHLAPGGNLAVNGKVLCEYRRKCPAAR